MRRRFCVVLLTIVAVGSTCADAFACGDKFLKPGRSARTRTYAPVHLSSIVVYAPGWKQRGIAAFEKMLLRAGHTSVVTVKTKGVLLRALADRKYDIVITSYEAADAVTKELDGLPQKPALLPVLYKGKKAEVAAARAAYQCLLRPERMTPADALEEIDRLRELQLKGPGSLLADR